MTCIIPMRPVVVGLPGPVNSVLIKLFALNHRLQHIQNRHHLSFRLPEESVSYAWIKAAESFEQLGEMGFQLRADRQD